MAHDEDQTTPGLHGAGPPAPQELGPGARVGPWRLTRLLGSGGMGEVWAAERADGVFEQRAAVKLVRADRGAEAIVGRFLAERQILASLDHPNIARLLDGGLAPDGRPYFALELVEGLPVTDWVRETRPSLEDLLGRVLDLCDAVEAAHQRLVVHRDIKPGNVLVTADGRLKLLDFGIAKVIEADVDTRETQLGGRPCTPAYAAPEQLLGEPVTTATDVYLIGALTFELLTGRPPFVRDPSALPRLLESLRTEEPPPPSRVAAAAPTLPGTRWAGRLRGDLDTVVTRALQADPARRYRTVAALADDLRRFLEGRPVTARPNTVAYRARKFVLRHRASAAAAAAAAVALCAGTGLALWQAAEARRAERLARDHERRAERLKDFVLSVFREQDPLLRSSVRARPAADVVREGLERARAELGSEPDLQADILSDLGAVQGDLGDLDGASAALEQALARRAAALPARDKRLAETRLSLSFVRVAQGRLEEAAELAEQTRSALAGEPGAAALLARAESHLGRIALLRGDARRSLQLSRQAYDRAAAALGPEDPEAVAYLVHVGLAAEAVGDLDQGVLSLEDAVARLEHRLGPSHVRLVVPLTALGDVLAAAQRLDDAERAYRRGLAIAEAQLGPGHRQVGALLKRMASVLSDHGQHALALEHSERARRVLARLGGVELGDAVNVQGRVLLAAGRPAAAAAAFEQAAQAFDQSLGPDSPYTLGARLWRGRAQVAAGQIEDGLRGLAAAHAGLARVSGEASADALEAAEWHGAALRQAGRAAEAERVLSGAIAALGDPKPESAAQLERLLRERALVRRGRGDVSGAERDAVLAEAASRKAQPAPNGE